MDGTHSNSTETHPQKPLSALQLFYNRATLLQLQLQRCCNILSCSSLYCTTFMHILLLSPTLSFFLYYSLLHPPQKPKCDDILLQRPPAVDHTVLGSRSKPLTYTANPPALTIKTTLTFMHLQTKFSMEKDCIMDQIKLN